MKISCASCLGLSLTIPAQFTFEMCSAAWNRKKVTKNPYFNVKGHSILFKFIDVGTNEKLISNVILSSGCICVFVTPCSPITVSCIKHSCFSWQNCVRL